MSRPLDVEVSNLARVPIVAAERWWRANRPGAPNAVREELERASSLISFQPPIDARARNLSLAGVRRLHLARVRYDLYYRVVDDLRRVEILSFWHAHRGGPPPL